MKHTYFFIIFTSFLIPTVVAAQVTLVAPLQMVARSGDSVTVELKAKTRDTLSTLQFTLVWNPAVLTFGRVDTLGGLPPSSEPSELGLTNISQGKLSFVTQGGNRGEFLPFKYVLSIHYTSFHNIFYFYIFVA